MDLDYVSAGKLGSLPSVFGLGRESRFSGLEVVLWDFYLAFKVSVCVSVSDVLRNLAL